MDRLKCTLRYDPHPEEPCAHNPNPFYLWRIQPLCRIVYECCYVRSEPHPLGGTSFYTQLQPPREQDICQSYEMLREIDAPVHLGCYSDGKHIQLACDESWVEPKWGTDEDRETADEEVYVADDDRLYTFNEKKASCRGCKE